jgi:MoxR-like ATPase
MLEAMEERQVSQDGTTRPLPNPFFVIATQNPVEQIGAYPLPESQLDRFLMAIELGYPDAAAERDLLVGGDRRAQIAMLGALADPPTLLEWQREAASAHVSPALLDYVQALLAASRGNVGSGVDAGARRGLSPRAGLLLMAAAAGMGASFRPADGAARGCAGSVPLRLPDIVLPVARATARCMRRHCSGPSRFPDGAASHRRRGAVA